jgi:exodeoxyribonuclease X
MSDPQLIRVVDLETTGTDEEEGAEIVEIARVDLILSTSDIGNGWSSLVRPKGPIPCTAMAVHHITDADVAQAPELREVLAEFEADMTEHDVFAAHNAKFEQHFLPPNPNRWICTYRCALLVWPDAPGHSNQVLRYWLGLDAEPDFAAHCATLPHRAEPDAFVTAFILRRLLLERSVDELVLYSSYPALLPVMRFGKHKGMKFSDAPSDYLEWIRDKSDMGEDVKFSAQYWLQKRAKARAAQEQGTQA